jgi:hypothetical protein
MSKMGLHDPFGHFKQNLWPKERPGVKVATWLPTTKSLESPRFPCMKVVCNILLKNSQQGLQLCFRPHFNWKFAHKIMGPQSYVSFNFENFETPTWESWYKMTFECWHKIYYKGEGDGFPHVRVVVSLVSLCLPVVRTCTKVLQLCTNQLVIWFVQVYVSD